MGLLVRSHYRFLGFCGEIFGVVFGEKEGTLSVNSRALNKAPMWWGFSVTDSWTLPIDPAKNTRKRTPIVDTSKRQAPRQHFNRSE